MSLFVPLSLPSSLFLSDSGYNTVNEWVGGEVVSSEERLGHTVRGLDYHSVPTGVRLSRTSVVYDETTSLRHRGE